MSVMVREGTQRVPLLLVQGIWIEFLDDVEMTPLVNFSSVNFICLIDTGRLLPECRLLAAPVWRPKLT